VPFRRAEPAPGKLGALGLLRERAGFRNLWLALSLSYTGSGLALTALLLYVQRTQGTGIAVAALLLAMMIPRLLGPLAGSLADRTDLRRVMIGCDLGQAAIYGGLAFLPPFGVVIAMVTLATLLQTAYSPARTAALPSLVGEDELMPANALLGTAFNMQIAAGPLIGGLLVAAGGTDLALGVNAGSFVLSALLTSFVPPLPPEPADPDAPPGLLASAREGFTYAMGHPAIRVVVLTLFFGLIFLSMDNVALVFLVRSTLGGGAFAFGLASGAFGLGMVTGALALLRRRALSAAAIYLVGLLLTGVGTLLTGIAPAIGLVVVLQAVAGLGNGIDNVASETLIQQRVPRAMLGRAFGLVTTAAFAGSGLASVIGGVLLDLTSPRAVLITAGVGGLAVTLIAIRWLGDRSDTSPGG
jgi:MFS family permease